MNKNIVFLFPIGLQKVHLKKDVGIVPGLFQKNHFHTTFFSYPSDEFGEGKFVDSDVNFIITSRAIYDFFKNVYRNQPHVVCFFHFSKLTLVCVLLMKFISPSSKIYIKGDYNFHDNWVFGKIGSKIIVPHIRLICKLSHTISCETRDTTEIINQLSNNKCVYFPNGIFPPEIVFIAKEDIAITVARLGTFQKNSELFLDIAKQMLIEKWVSKIYAIGTIEYRFHEYVKEFFVKNPELKEKIIFLGSIEDPIELKNFYKKTKYFILTSRYESFGIVLSEAASKGCILISTDVGSAVDITDNWKFGIQIKTNNIFVNKIVDTDLYQKHLLSFDWDKNFRMVLNRFI